VPRATTYLGASEGTIASRWRDLGSILDSVATSPESEDSIIAGAHAALASQRRWFGQPAQQSVAERS